MNLWPLQPEPTQVAPLIRSRFSPSTLLTAHCCWGEAQRDGRGVAHPSWNIADFLHIMRSCDARMMSDETEKMVYAKTTPRPKNRLLISLYRLGALVIISLLWVCRQQADAYLERGWQFFRANRLFQHESFEPFLSAASFFFFVGFWGLLDFLVPSASKHRTFPSDDLSSWFGGTRIRDQALWYIFPLVTLDILFPRRQLPESPPSFVRLVLEVVGAIAVYDIAFFAWHSTVHIYPALYRRVHAVHHRCHVQRAPEAVRHTFIDGTMDVACSVFALNILGCHPLSRAVYDVVVIGLITELHAGYDFPWQLHNLVPFGLFGGAPRHERHHRHGKVYMQKFGTYLDAVFGFVPLEAEERCRKIRFDVATLQQWRRPFGAAWLG